MRRRLTLALVAVIAVIGVVAWFVFGRAAGIASDSRSDASQPPSEVGAPPLLAPAQRERRTKKPAGEVESGDTPSPSPTRGGISIHGTVRGPDGEVVGSANVYAVTKTRTEADGHRFVAKTIADALGAWSLDVPTLDGVAIGAVRSRFRPAFADGDALASRVVGGAVPGDVVLTLGRPGVVSASVVDADRHGIADVSLSLQQAGTAEEARLPAPGQPFADLAEANTDSDGHATLRSGRTGAVTVVATADGFYAEPASIELPSAEGSVEFTMRPSCAIDLRVVHAGTGAPVADGFQWEIVTDPAGELVSRASFSGAEGETDWTTEPIRPGTYRVLVTSPGRRPWTSDPITFKTPGQRVAVTATLERDDSAGDLVLALTPATVDGVRVPIVSQWFLVYLRRRTEKDARWESPPVLAQRVAESEEALLPRCPAGTYDLILWDLGASVAVAASNIVIRAGVPSRYVLALRRGIEVHMQDLVASADERPKTWIRSATMDRLPLLFSDGYSDTMTQSGERMGEPYFLGPYPFDSLTVTLEGADGKRREVTLPKK